jgi:hypothetical protein
VNKVRAQRVHAKRRAYERYGLTLNRLDLRGMVQQIQGGRAVFVERESLRLTRWIVVVHDLHVTVVFDAQRHAIVTCLPLCDAVARQEP